MDFKYLSFFLKFSCQVQICFPSNFQTVNYLSWHNKEKEMATHSSILAWRIPWTEEPGGLQSMGLQRAGHDWATFTSLHIPRKKRKTDMVDSYQYQPWCAPSRSCDKRGWLIKRNVSNYTMTRSDAPCPQPPPHPTHHCHFYDCNAVAYLTTSSPLRSRWKIYNDQTKLMRTCHCSLHLKTRSLWSCTHISAGYSF